MSLTLLQIVQEMCGRTGLLKPVVVSGTLDPQTLQFLSLLNEEVEEITRRFDLQEMLAQATFNLVAAESQGTMDAIAGAPVKNILNNVLWNRTTRLPIWGPVRPQLWQWYKALPVTGTLYQYRFRGNELLINPTPATAGDLIAFEYVRKYAVYDAEDAAYKQFFTKDTDTCLLPDDVLIAGLRWRWKREKGLPYAEDKVRYEGIASDHALTDGTKRQLKLTGSDQYLPAGIVIPLNNWNV